MFTLRSFTRILLAGTVLGSVAMLRTDRVALADATVVKGPAWISIETPVNPYDASTRGAFLLVHAFHHGDAMASPVTGRAEASLMESDAR